MPFERLDWQSIPEHASKRECWVYSRAYYKAAEEREAAGDLAGRDGLHLLGKCTALRLVPENPDEPFDAVFRFPTGRSPILEDITAAELQVVRELTQLARDAELRARLADVCWVAGRDYQRALLAMDSYVEAATVLDGAGEWLEAKDRLERAMRIAAQLGRGNAGRMDNLVTHIEKVLAAHDDTIRERYFQPAHLMALLLEFDRGDSQRWSDLSEHLALFAEQSRDWERAQTYWERKAEWDTLRGDTVAKQASLVRAAELYVEIANEFLRRPEPDHLSASIQLVRAIEAMRRLGEKERAEQLHHELIKHQALATGQFKTFSEEMDVSQFVEQAIGAVSVKTFPNAIVTLAKLCRPPDLTSLRDYAERVTKEFVFQAIFTQQRVDSRGRVVATKPSALGQDPEKTEEAIRAEMLEHASRLRGTYVVATIEPARFQILREHRVRFEDFMSLVSNNPLVPPHREVFFARGLHAGLTGDFLIACHLLVPQLEQAIRFVLNERGVITTTMSSEGIQEELDLGKLLEQPKLTELLGADLVFDLKGLLVERFGANLRNLLAHGLLELGHFYSQQAIYLWWLTLRICCLPILVQMDRSHAEGPPSGDTEDRQPEDAAEDCGSTGNGEVSGDQSH